MGTIQLETIQTYPYTTIGIIPTQNMSHSLHPIINILNIHSDGGYNVKDLLYIEIIEKKKKRRRRNINIIFIIVRMILF